MQPTQPRLHGNAHGFASTHWTIVRECVGSGVAVQAAREALCRDYWYPVYVYIKKLGRQECDAEDLTQDFFADILNRPWFEHAEPAKGRFRSFLLASLNRYLQDCFDRQRRQKRGGGKLHIPLDLGNAETRYAASLASQVDSADAYETEWAANLVEVAWGRLESMHVAAGKALQFEALKVFLTTAGSEAGYGTVAGEFDMTIASVKVAVHRLRKQYGAILREEVARTVGSAQDVAAEMQHIRQAVAHKMGVAA